MPKRAHLEVMDPLSITASCAALLSSISKLSIQLSTFALEIRDARKDIEAVQRELSSMKLCLEMLHNDVINSNFDYPFSLQKKLVDIVHNADSVAVEISQMLRKMSSTSIGRKIQWSLMVRSEMDKLKSNLESHKSAIEIALDMVSM